MFLRNTFIFVYLLVTAFIFATFDTSISLWLSFFSNAIIITFITYFHIFIEKTYSPFLSTYIVFNFLFFLVAPMSQASTMTAMEFPVYGNQFPFDEWVFIKTNFLISGFHIVFFLTYIGTKTLIKTTKKPPVNLKGKTYIIPFIFLILSALIIITNFGFLVDEFTRPSWKVSDYNISDLLIRTKVLFIIPLAGIVISTSYLIKSKLTASKWLFLIISIAVFLIFLLVLKNPLTEKRNALGPIYLLLIFLFYPKLMNSNVKTTFLLFFSMIVAFPALQFLTHVDYGIADLISNPSLFLRKNDLNLGYMSLNYDAFINIGVVIEIVEENGLSYGFQSLSAFLFFVPRSLWLSKPDSSGLVVGDHLIERYDFWFANLSNPLVSEGYMNFGYFGVFLMAFLLAITIVYFLTWLNSKDYLKKAIAFYFAMHLIFLLRGDFTNGFSYFIGTLIGLYIVPKSIIYLIGIVLDQKIWVSKKN
ncbi:O-antigen polysaccharide polymerase Wzy [Nonlabens sp. MB-3u-79]|nr:O-antigen polysaccharide polymerase Wzy [Nonlabens sp. MB-3u-79]